MHSVFAVDAIAESYGDPNVQLSATLSCISSTVSCWRAASRLSGPFSRRDLHPSAGQKIAGFQAAFNREHMKASGWTNIALIDRSKNTKITFVTATANSALADAVAATSVDSSGGRVDDNGAKLLFPCGLSVTKGNRDGGMGGNDRPYARVAAASPTWRLESRSQAAQPPKRWVLAHKNPRLSTRSAGLWPVGCSSFFRGRRATMINSRASSPTAPTAHTQSGGDARGETTSSLLTALSHRKPWQRARAATKVAAFLNVSSRTRKKKEAAQLAWRRLNVARGAFSRMLHQGKFGAMSSDDEEEESRASGGSEDRKSRRKEKNSRGCGRRQTTSNPSSSNSSAIWSYGGDFEDEISDSSLSLGTGDEVSAQPTEPVGVNEQL